MQQQSFFPSANRKVIIGSPTKQATTGRICVPIRMPLTGESLVAAPDWVGECYEAVSKYLAQATPEVEQIADITVAFANAKPKGKLFDDPSAKVPSAEMKAFCVQRCGEDENPDVELVFKLYAPFSREFWAWLGEMAGVEVYMAFPRSLGGGMAKPDPAVQGTLAVDQEPSEAEKAALRGDANPPADAPKPKGKKSGAKELAAFHAGQVN
jgi:hypothetical protein